MVLAKIYFLEPGWIDTNLSWLLNDDGFVCVYIYCLLLCCPSAAPEMHEEFVSKIIDLFFSFTVYSNICSACVTAQFCIFLKKELRTEKSTLSFFWCWRFPQEGAFLQDGHEFKFMLSKISPLNHHKGIVSPSYMCYDFIPPKISCYINFLIDKRIFFLVRQPTRNLKKSPGSSGAMYRGTLCSLL